MAVGSRVGRTRCRLPPPPNCNKGSSTVLHLDVPCKDILSLKRDFDPLKCLETFSMAEKIVLEVSKQEF